MTVIAVNSIEQQFLYIERQVDRQVEGPVYNMHTRGSHSFITSYLVTSLGEKEASPTNLVQATFQAKILKGEESNKEWRKVRLLPKISGPIHFLINGSIRSFATTAHH